DPSPKRKLTPNGWALEKASASVTSGLFGRCGPQWLSTKAAAPSSAADSRTLRVSPPVTAPVQVLNDIVVQRSPTKSVLLKPSVISPVRKRLFRRKLPSLLPGLSDTPPLPLTAV